MAWASVGILGAVDNATANQASLVLTTGASALEAGNVGVLILAVDNNQTTDGDEGAVTGVVDSAGNTWSKAVEFTNGQGSAQDGATCSVWYVKAATQLAAGGTITASFSNSTSRDASAARVWEFTIGAGSTVSVETTNTLANDGADPGSLDAATASAEFLRIRAIASESDSLISMTNTASWTDMGRSVADPGVSAIGQGIRGEFIISTGTGSASDPTLFSADHASVYVVLKEVSGAISGSTDATFSLSGALTGSGALLGESSVTFSMLGTLAGAGALTGAASLAFDVSGTGLSIGFISGASSLTFAVSGAVNFTVTGAWINPDGLAIVFPTYEGKTFHSIISPLSIDSPVGKLRYDQPNPFKFRRMK